MFQSEKTFSLLSLLCNFHPNKYFAKARLNSKDNPKNKLCYFSTTTKKRETLMLMILAWSRLKICAVLFPSGRWVEKTSGRRFFPSASISEMGEKKKFARLFNHKLMRLCVDSKFTSSPRIASWQNYPYKIHVHTFRRVIKYSSNFFICLSSK